MTYDAAFVVLFLCGIWGVGVFCCWREWGVLGAVWWGTGMTTFLGAGLFLDLPDWVWLLFMIGWFAASWWMIPAEQWARDRQEWKNISATAGRPVSTKTVLTEVDPILRTGFRHS